MFNEILWIAFALINFLLLILAYRLFGKQGLFMWIAFATIIANLQVIKTIELFGFIVTLGNIIYGTAFLATDIINEKYGKEEAKKAVWMGFFSLLAMTIIMQAALQFTPHDEDISQDALSLIFGFLPRLALGSLLAYIVSQYIDVFIYSFLKRIFPSDSQLWLRNNGSTMISQFVDTMIFTSIAFLGVYPWEVWIEIFLTTYLIKWIVALMDTPFMYWAKAMHQSSNN
ncbi:queuosine precursor transporter [Pseudalkalibacillus caeni]|uniref:Probable queuosine precursor transporter n=1 Tax=Exobacillus caeni TaxID=2574798 RepID=A0A5R9F795_9BACL|nr:queuosine precursor transporter [Pseudalkalibacillus caeni]TLS37498.1 VUT family protein [Pseudalkalibacillus caeni]